MASYRPLLDRGMGLMRTGARRAGRLGRYGASFGAGMVQRALASRGPKDLDDVTLARKVETEIFRGADAPKSSVNVNAVDGVVWLRGEVKHPEDVKAIEAKARSIPEVRDVENLLHLPKTPAPSRTDTPASQRKTRSSGTKKQTPRRTPRRVSGQKERAEAEPTPREVAEQEEGRKPAPLGSNDRAS